MYFENEQFTNGHIKKRTLCKGIKIFFWKNCHFGNGISSKIWLG